MSKGLQDHSLAEKLENAIKQLGFWYRISIIIVLVGLASLSGIISMSQFYFHDEIAKYGQIQEIFIQDKNITVLAFLPYSEEIFPAEGIVSLYITQVWLMYGNGVVIALLSFLFVWVTYRGKAHTQEFESIEQQFIRQSYLVNFETSVPEGTTKVEKILNEAIHVFPALKEVQRKAKLKQTKIPYKLAQKYNGETIDGIVSTKKGDFIVKFYEKTVSESDLINLVKILSKSRDKIFRVLCVAPDYEEDLQSNKLVEIMDKIPKYFKLDLIFEEEHGYSMLWID
ncbi:hypothetical protein MnTg01_00728 [archaeon MnTg01]|nr:hypothetical protein MnTg01_00728 [archaeon MnTg01]